ncbi:hypothetical protein G9A89_016327 [Geosiphon pyriformis]|nr:hypothetical protein G9A89_016327 [Geosiphon pyriformis]
MSFIDHDKSIIKVKKFSIESLPKTFLEFLKENEINPIIYQNQALPRYIRLNTNHKNPVRRDELEAELKGPVKPVTGIDGFFEVDGKSKIATCQSYKEGKIFGIDLSSGIAVHALEIQPNDHILDLCCAPGAKLCMICDLLGNKGVGTVTGVDISKNRAATCRSLLKKYKVIRARIFVEDGTRFSVLAPSDLIPLKRALKIVECQGDENFGDEDLNREGNFSSPQCKEDIVIKPFWAPKILRNDPQKKDPLYLYDKVIVDAECTHDGSIAHILKYEKWGWEAFEKNFMDPDRVKNLWSLQRNLLENAWKLLKPGGILVYSTCTLSPKQNEDVIGWFLTQHLDSKLEPIIIGDLKTATIKKTQYMADLSLTVRFDPVISKISGFFVARIRKISLTSGLD